MPSITEKTGAEINSLDPDAPTLALTILVVDDDAVSRKMLLAYLGRFFALVFSAKDGNQGFELFCEHKPDIVLTDQMMPGLSGLELMGKIRETGAMTPVVLMTCSMDAQTLQEAINAGVDRFVPKPFDFSQIARTLFGLAVELTSKRLLEQHRRNEIELLRYRDAYNSLQQEAAQRKERHVVRHDLHRRILKGAGGARWGMNVVYSPRDIMCGDGYSVRNLFDGRQLMFIVDAMGSGMSASLTAMLATSFCNYQIANLHLWENFTLRMFLKRFQEYLSGMLLEEEVLSCGFMLLDLENEEVETAFFGLPPLLVRDLDGSIRKIRGENPPLGIYQSEAAIGTLSLTNVADLLVMTDGVTDALLTSGGSYREELEGDFRAAPTIASLQRRFKRRTVPGVQDDSTLLHLLRLDIDSVWSWSATPDLTLTGLSRTIRDFLEALAIEADMGNVERDELEVMLTEALTNALEHGCMGIDRDEKTRLQMEGDYEDALESKAVLPDACITLSATLWRVSEQPLLIVEVRDNGSGVPDSALSENVEWASVNGRGLQMIKHYSDFFFIDGPGGHLIILKTLEGGDNYAD